MASEGSSGGTAANATGPREVQPSRDAEPGDRLGPLGEARPGADEVARCEGSQARRGRRPVRAANAGSHRTHAKATDREAARVPGDADAIALGARAGTHASGGRARADGSRDRALRALLAPAW